MVWLKKFVRRQRAQHPGAVTRLARRRRLLLALLLLALGGLLLYYLLAAPVRTGVHTALFVLQVLDVPVKPQSWITPEPIRQQVTYPQPAGHGVADIYRIPDDKPRAAALIFLGANATGRDDADVVNLGNALARSGFVPMFHWSPTMGLRNNVDPTEVENLVWAFQYLQTRDFVDPERLGMGGFSVGASFALVAAADARIRDDVVFINAFGPYYDARDLMLQTSARSVYYRDQLDPWEPDQLTMRVLANELIETLPDPGERALLEGRFIQDRDIPATEMTGLSQQGQLARQMLEGTTLPEAERLYRELPEDFRQAMQSISPSAHLSGLKARVMLMHAQNDRLIPATESRRMADALAGRGNFYYTEVQAFEHVRPSGGGLWVLVKEGFKLYRHMYGIIRVAT